jgi:nucleotide-binding universal stress UspA family protein
MDIVQELPSDLKLLLTEAPLVQLQQAGVEERKDRLEALLAPHQRQGLAVRTVVAIGVPFLEMIRQVIREKHDLLIKAASDSRLGQRSSTDNHLLRKSPCPVWLIQGRGRYFNRILAAVEPGGQDETADALNHKIMELAITLGRREKARVHVASAWFFAAAELASHWGVRLPRGQMTVLYQDILNARQKWLSALVEEHAGKRDRVQTHLIKGDAGRGIPKLARRLGADLVVMGTLARAGVPGFFIGNSAEEMLQAASGSILAVKPDWFISPVRLEDE